MKKYLYLCLAILMIAILPFLSKAEILKGSFSRDVFSIKPAHDEATSEKTNSRRKKYSRSDLSFPKRNRIERKIIQGREGIKVLASESREDFEREQEE